MLPRCPDCPNASPDCDRYHWPLIYGDGPAPCPVLTLGAGPGKHEVARHRVYAGPAGEELDETYYPRGGMRRGDNVYTGNVTLCHDGSDRPPSDKRVQSCARFHLPGLLERVRPEVVILQGGAACRIADKRIRLDLHRGRPQWGSLLGGLWTGWIWPMFEPALGMRDTPKMTQILGDWVHFGKWMKGEWKPPEPVAETMDYQLIEEPDGLRRYLALYRRGFVSSVAVDTEKHGGQPWSMQFSIRPGTGAMIQATGMVQECLLGEFDWWLKEEGVEVVLHNAPQDLDTLDAMGIHVGRFRDTMQEAYQTNSLPQGLKQLSHHFFGVEMKGWQETVWPASVDALTTWAEKAILVAAETLSDADVKHLARGKCGVCGHQHSTGPCKRCGCVAGPDHRV